MTATKRTYSRRRQGRRLQRRRAAATPLKPLETARAAAAVAVAAALLGTAPAAASPRSGDGLGVPLEALSVEPLAQPASQIIALPGDATGAPARAAPMAALQARLSAAGAQICGRPSPNRGAPRADGAASFAPEAAHPDAPWMAKLEIVERVGDDGVAAIANCGAAALTRDWLLTAAHCVATDPTAPPDLTAADAIGFARADGGGSAPGGGTSGRTLGSWLAVEATLGAKDLDDPRAIRRAVTVSLCPATPALDEISEAAARSGPATGRDLALLRVDPPLPPFFPTLRVASDPEIDRLAVGARALSAGWRKRPSGLSRKLSAPVVRIAPHEGEPAEIIVAAPERNESSLCLGESGAPLVADFGYGPAVIGVFTSVDAIFDPETGRIEELCSGFEARSYFTSLAGLQGWLSDSIHACDAYLDACLGRAVAAAKPEKDG